MPACFSAMSDRNTLDSHSGWNPSRASNSRSITPCTADHTHTDINGSVCCAQEAYKITMDYSYRIIHSNDDFYLLVLRLSGMPVTTTSIFTGA
jgi:hypothetical protein